MIRWCCLVFALILVSNVTAQFPLFEVSDSIHYDLAQADCPVSFKIYSVVQSARLFYSLIFELDGTEKDGILSDGWCKEFNKAYPHFKRYDQHIDCIFCEIGRQCLSILNHGKIENFRKIAFNKIIPLTDAQIRELENKIPTNLAPGIPPSDTSTTVWSYWGGSVYHKDTCRFIIGSKKVKELLFCFSVERATKMGLKPCSTCFKAQKVVKAVK